jgi:hypothetical protein
MVVPVSAAGFVLGAGVCVLGLCSCAPLTFSERSKLDFARYRAVAVSVSAAPGSSTVDLSGYLADELRAHSGFQTVTTNRAAPVDLFLDVEVRWTADSDNTTIDASADYLARTPAGTLVVQGSETDNAGSVQGAVEDALDEVVLDFIEPYRL